VTITAVLADDDDNQPPGFGKGQPGKGFGKGQPGKGFGKGFEDKKGDKKGDKTIIVII